MKHCHHYDKHQHHCFTLWFYTCVVGDRNNLHVSKLPWDYPLFSLAHDHVSFMVMGWGGWTGGVTNSPSALRLKNFKDAGYSNIQKFFTGRSMHNDSIFGWFGHMKNGSTYNSMEGMYNVYICTGNEPTIYGNQDRPLVKFLTFEIRWEGSKIFN